VEKGIQPEIPVTSIVRIRFGIRCVGFVKPATLSGIGTSLEIPVYSSNPLQ
jgi:hypothetical protein